MLNLTQPPKDGDISQQMRIELMVLLQQCGHTRKCQSEWGEWWWTMTLVSFWGTPSSDKSHVCVCLCQNLGISSIQVTEAGGAPDLYKCVWSWKLTSHPVVEISMDISWHIPLGSWGWWKAMELSIWITSCFPFRWKRWSHKVRIKAAITGQEVGRHVSREREGGKRYATSQHMSAAFAYCMPVAHKYCQYRVLCLKLGSMLGQRW